MIRSGSARRTGWNGVCVSNEQTCRTTVLGGQLYVLCRLRGQDCPWDSRTYRAVADGGHLMMLQWSREQVFLGQVNVHNSGCGRASTDTVVVEGAEMHLDELTCTMVVGDDISRRCSG